jgi:hypothetical protein
MATNGLKPWNASAYRSLTTNEEISLVDTKDGPVGAGLISRHRPAPRGLDILFFLPKHEVHAGCVTEIVRIMVVVAR